MKVRPAAPTVTSSDSHLDEGDPVSLTCVSTTSGISKYGFSKDGISLADSRSNTYTIAMATGADAGTYTCDVTKDGVTSLASAGVKVRVEVGELHNDPKSVNH